MTVYSSTKSDDQLPSDEVVRRRDEVIKRMLNTPPQPRRAKPKPDKAKEHEPDKERAHRPKHRS